MVNKAVILAAGIGKRIQGESTNISKPLIQVAGLPLIKRVILTLQNEGFNEVFVIVGYEKNQIIDFINNDKQITVKVTFVHNNEYEKSNGISLLKAKDYVKENFVLLMSDHVFDKNILKLVRNTEPKEKEAFLCIDRKIDSIFDIDDATKVLIDHNKKILEINKSLTDYNAIDTGIFLCTPYIFEALEKSIVNGDCSLSDGMRYLAKQNLFNGLDIGNCFWQDVDTPATISHAEKLLLQSLIKPSDGIISRNINRKISLAVTKMTMKYNIPPNFMTAFTFLFGVLSIIFVVQGKYIHGLIGGLFYQLCSIWDGCDGEIARLKFMSTKLGTALDSFIDDGTSCCIMWAMGVYSYKYHDNIGYLYFGVLGSIIFLAYKLIQYYDLTKNKNTQEILDYKFFFEEKKELTIKDRIYSILKAVSRNDMFSFIVMLAGILNLYHILVICLATLVPIFFIVVLYQTFLVNKNPKSKNA